MVSDFSPAGVPAYFGDAETLTIKVALQTYIIIHKDRRYARAAQPHLIVFSSHLASNSTAHIILPTRSGSVLQTRLCKSGTSPFRSHMAPAYRHHHQRQ